MALTAIEELHDGSKPAAPEAAPTEENTIVVTFQEAKIGIKFGKLGSSKASRALAPMHIKESSLCWRRSAAQIR